MSSNSSALTNVPWFDRLPISVNDTYGDPFIPEQVDNTIEKLRDLMQHCAPIAIFTKAGYNATVLNKLQAVRDNRMVVVFYSLTGLGEAQIPFENRVAMIEALGQIFQHVVVFTRPIIKGRNDSPENLQRLVDVAAAQSKLLVLGGLHDKYKNKKIDFSVEDLLIGMCDQAGVKCFHKTGCCAAYLHDTECWVHDQGAPRDLDVAAALGYHFTVQDECMYLEQASTGDLNFLRMLTRTKIVARHIISNYNLLSIPTGSQKYEATSSWYAWSENIETCLDCDYCIIKQIEYLKKMKVKIGTHPREMVDIVAANRVSHDFTQFRLTKMREEWIENAHTYDDVRVTKPCFRQRYAPHHASSARAVAGLRVPLRNADKHTIYPFAG